MNETVKDGNSSSCVKDEKTTVTVTEEEHDSDLFFSESNMAYLRRGISALNEGRGVVHEIVDVD